MAHFKKRRRPSPGAVVGAGSGAEELILQVKTS